MLVLYMGTFINSTSHSTEYIKGTFASFRANATKKGSSLAIYVVT